MILNNIHKITQQNKYDTNITIPQKKHNQHLPPAKKQHHNKTPLTDSHKKAHNKEPKQKTIEKQQDNWISSDKIKEIYQDYYN